MARKARPRGRPTHEDAVKLREEFLEVALDAFLEEGFARCSMEGIAERARVSKNTVYLQYGSKEELFRRAALVGVRRLRSTLALSVPMDTPIDAGVASIVERVQRSTQREPVRRLARLVIAEAQHFPELAAELLTEARELIAPVVTYLESAQRRGEISVADPEMAAVDLLLLSLGVRFFLGARPRPAPQNKQAAQRVASTVLLGWKPRPGTK